jgi:hypothetical protein
MENSLKGYQVAMICRNKAGGLDLVTNNPKGSYALQTDGSK